MTEFTDVADFSIDPELWAEQLGVDLPVEYGPYKSERQSSAAAAADEITQDAKKAQLNRIWQALMKKMSEGATYAEWKKTLHEESPSLQIPEHRLDNIFRTNVLILYARGRCLQQERNAHIYPYYMYDAVNDSRTRPAHSAMHGIVKRHDDQFWSTNTPPNGFRCRCRRIALSKKQSEKYEKKDAERHQKNPKLATARANARPDAGWDFAICAKYKENLKNT